MHHKKKMFVVHICWKALTNVQIAGVLEHSPRHSMCNALWSPVQASSSHTCCICVHNGLCPTCKLRQSDNSLPQQYKLLWSPDSLSAQSISLCSSSSSHGAPRNMLRTDPWWHRSLPDAATVQVASCTELLFVVICHSQNCTHPCSPKPQSVMFTGVLYSLSNCYMRPSSHGWSHTCQGHPHSYHHSH